MWALINFFLFNLIFTDLTCTTKTCGAGSFKPDPALAKCRYPAPALQHCVNDKKKVNPVVRVPFATLHYFLDLPLSAFSFPTPPFYSPPTFLSTSTYLLPTWQGHTDVGEIAPVAERAQRDPGQPLLVQLRVDGVN